MVLRTWVSKMKGHTKYPAYWIKIDRCQHILLGIYAVLRTKVPKSFQREKIGFVLTSRTGSQKTMEQHLQICEG